MAPLTSAQRQTIARLARELFDHEEGLGLASVPPGLGRGAAVDLFRATCNQAFCGVASTRDCTQAHFCCLMGHYHRRLGNEGEALRWFLKDGQEATKTALYWLERHCQKAGVEFPTYPLAIAVDKYRHELQGRALASLSARTLWKLCFAIKGRRPEAFKKGPKAEQAAGAIVETWHQGEPAAC